MDRNTTTNTALDTAAIDHGDGTTEITSQAVVPFETIKDRLYNVVVTLAPWSNANHIDRLAGWFLTGLGWGLVLHRRQTGEGLLISLLGFAFPQTYLAVTSGLMVIEHYFKA